MDWNYKIASKKVNLDLMETIHTYAMVSISLFDAFIICWDEKWRSILVRPETVINQHIDSDWIPFLQTPPFLSILLGTQLFQDQLLEY